MEDRDPLSSIFSLFAERLSAPLLQLFSDYVPVVLYVMSELVLFDRAETGVGEVFSRLLFTPHRSQPFSSLRQRHRHAVHA